MITDIELNLLWNQHREEYKGYGPWPEDFTYKGSPLTKKYPNSELVEDFGGEGLGDHAHVVIRVDDKLFKIDGYYSSYDGTDWDTEWYEVKPAEKTITVYEKV